MGNHNAEMINFDSTSGYSSEKKGYFFDGTNDYMRTSGLSGITSSITVEAVGTISNYNSLGWVRTLYSTGDEALNKIIWLGYGFQTTYRPYSEVGFATYRLSYNSTDNNPIKLNETFYLSLTYNNGYLSTYKNGLLVGTQGPSSTNIIIDDPYAYVGTYKAGMHLFNGTIKSIRIYNRALNDSEILQNYSIDKSRFGM
jgi:hypothetical protein